MHRDVIDPAAFLSLNQLRAILTLKHKSYEVSYTKSDTFKNGVSNCHPPFSKKTKQKQKNLNCKNSLKTTNKSKGTFCFPKELFTIQKIIRAPIFNHASTGPLTGPLNTPPITCYLKQTGSYLISSFVGELFTLTSEQYVRNIFNSMWLKPFDKRTWADTDTELHWQTKTRTAIELLWSNHQLCQIKFLLCSVTVRPFHIDHFSVSEQTFYWIENDILVILLSFTR